MKTTLAVSTASFALSFLLAAAPGTSRADNLFVVTGNTVEEFNSSGVGTTFASSGLDGPTGMASDSAGNLYVLNAGNLAIEEFTPQGVGSVFARTGSNNYPKGLACDSTGDLYMGDQGGDFIWKVTPQGVASIFVGSPEGGYANASYTGAMACGAGLYAGDWGNDSGSGYVERFGLGTGADFGVFASLGANNYPNGLAFDSAGNLYASYNNTVEKFTPSGVGSVFATGLSSPTGLAFDSAGNLYVANSGNGTIEEFNTNGVGSVFATGLNSPTFIAIQVPEPSTWAMVAVGIAAVLGGLRLRRRSS
ncbi:MAG TPA: PEP-CTERM sorting domain-containing protein [Verrucomicrobiae bacterium]|nr:PEP-CTERM sorting domain-containing protein [Verrucomicrobiae bacterium]